jgi:GT2 family glycosyltransferase
MSSLCYMGVLNSLRREPDIVFRGLRSFFRQNPQPVKVFFIDQNELKLELPEDLQNDPRLIHHHQPVPSVGLARNLVSSDPGVDWLVFCDDDGFLADDYVSNLVQILAQRPELELVAGPYVHETDGRYYSRRHAVAGRLDTILGSKLLLGSNISIRPHTYNRIGRYDPRFGPGSFWPSSDETDLAWRAQVAKVPMLYSPDIRVFHPSAHSADTREAIAKAYRYGRGKGALVAKWMFECPHPLGYWEFFEMHVIPFVNMVYGCLHGEFRQISIQFAVLRGRYRGFWEFVWRRGTPGDSKR